MRMSEFCKKVSSLYVYNIKFGNVPEQAVQVDEKPIPDALVDSSNSATYPESISYNQPYSFTTRIVTSVDDINEIISLIRNSKIQWGKFLVDGWQCSPTLASDVIEIRMVNGIKYKIIYHNFRKEMDDAVAEMS